MSKNNNQDKPTTKPAAPAYKPITPAADTVTQQRSGFTQTMTNQPRRTK
ncbi:hypothetical protein AB0O14_19210 [Microbacterium foliorum]